MPAPVHLLERAYQLINANQIQNAELVLDAVVRVDPQNMSAWKTYLMIHQDQNDLDWLKDRILKTRELSKADKTKLISYYLHLTRQLNGTKEVAAQMEPITFPLHEEKEPTAAPEKTTSQFELIEMFDYPTKAVKSEKRIKLRQRAIYNPFAFDTSGILEAMSRSPRGAKFADHFQKTVALIRNFAKNPQETCASLSKSPHFDKYTEAALLVLFLLGVRLAISGNFLGYVFLGMFVFGGRWWLVKFWNHDAANQGGQSRVYLHENKVNLPEIKEIDQAQKSNKKRSRKTVK